MFQIYNIRGLIRKFVEWCYITPVYELNFYTLILTSCDVYNAFNVHLSDAHRSHTTSIMVLPENEELRAAVKFCFNLGYSATETYNNMNRAQHTNDMKKATVFKRFKRFKDGRSNISYDDAQKDHPLSRRR